MRALGLVEHEPFCLAPALGEDVAIVPPHPLADADITTFTTGEEAEYELGLIDGQ